MSRKKPTKKNKKKSASSTKKLQNKLKGQLNAADEYYNMGITSNAHGKPEKAVYWFRRVLEINPLDVDAHYNLGIALNNCGQIEDSINCYKALLKIKPDDVQAFNNLGTALQSQGHIKQAIFYYEKAVEICPTYTKAINNLGIIYSEIGRLDDAKMCFEKAIEINKNDGYGYYHLANMRFSEDPKQAIRLYHKALSVNPNQVDYLSNLGNALYAIGQTNEAIVCFRRAIKLAPKNPSMLQLFANALKDWTFVHPDDDLLDDLFLCLSSNGIDKQGLAKVTVELLSTHPSFHGLLHEAQLANQIPEQPAVLDELTESSNVTNMIKALSHPIIALLLKNVIITTPTFETLLTFIRKHLLVYAFEDQFASETGAKALPIIFALAHQCYINEYVYFETEKEKQLTNKLKYRIENELKQGTVLPILSIGLLACYRPLFDLDALQKLIDYTASIATPDLEALIKIQIKDRLEEEYLKKKIEILRPINDDTSKLVSAQYEENPYPRWLDTFYATPRPFSKRMQLLFPHLTQAEFKISPFPSILIAGAGTGKHPIQCAQTICNAHITAMDLSTSSLAYGMRKAKELGITNIKFLKGDLLDADQLAYSFDVIECCGVLHHLKNPVKGWQTLAKRLKPEGYMKIALYSKTARAHIVAARSFIEENHFKATPDGIKTCRREIFSLPDDTPVKQVTRSQDFYSTSGCRDLIFHVQEHLFTLAEIAEIIDRLGFDFIGFDMNDPRIPRLYVSEYPNDPKALSIEQWQRFEEDHPAAFASMYQFWVKKRSDL